MKVRRVVTGHDAVGKAVFASDEERDPFTSPLLPGWAFHRLWGADGPATFPDDGSPTPQPTYFPPVGGYRFAIFTVPPAGWPRPSGETDPAAAADLEAALP